MPPRDRAATFPGYFGVPAACLIPALRTRGPLTASQAGRLFGESSGTCSFHLRQLAKYGLVKETGEGAGLRPALWVAVIGSVAGAALLVPSPLPRFRLLG